MASAFPKKTSTPRLLSREKLKSVTLLPSKLLREKFLNVKKANTGTSFLPRIGPFPHTSETGQKLPPVPPKKSFFQVSPPEIIFQNFDAHEVSEMQLSFINTDKFPRLVKVSMKRSPYFELLCPNDAYHIMPPGVSSPVHIRFTPKKNKNYSHQLVCLTPREQVVVPIRAIAARAILEFPEQLDFSECPVKYSTQKTVLLRNVGNLEAHFQLSTRSPFFVVPASGTLGVGDTMQVTVGFHPLMTGDHSGSLEVCCNTGGKSIHTNLHGEAVNVAIELSTNSVKVGKTFITTSNCTTMFIKNRSNITAHFQWKTFRTEADEVEEKRRQCYLLQPLKEAPLKTFIGEENIEQEMAKVQEDPMLFSDDIFSIEPMEGEIEPNRCAKITVTFKPLEELDYRSVAYCNISGRESRLPLRLRGEGQGPLVELSNRTLNLGNILLNTPYVYEVKLINQAAIDAPFTYIHTTANVGYCFKFAPEKGTIAPGGIQTIQISFNANILGSFEEQFQFIVAGSPTSAILTIKGFVTRPTVHFDMEEIDFGDISFGFPYTKTCRLSNPSPVALTFQLRMSDNGRQPSVNCFEQIRKPNDPSWRDGIHFDVEPKEFTMNPSQGTILPWEHQDIEVTLCPKTVMEFYRRLLVDLEGIGEEMAILRISARCLVPELRVYPHVLLYDECRLKVPYERKFLVVNNTDLPGCYGLIPQKRKENTPVFYSSRKPCGIVQPHSIAEIPVVIEVQRLGKHRTSVLVGVFGDERNPRRQELRSTGQLADIYPSPRLIEFGMIPALQPNSQIFTLINGGLVSMEFRIEIARKPHCYVIEPREGVIPALGEVPVTITATLDDTGLFADTIQLFTGNSLSTAFVLVAVGTGTTIAIDKPFVPELNLGYQFRLLPCIHRFKVTNRGHHFHRLFWSVGCHSPPEEEGQSVSALSIPRAKDDCQSPKRTRPVFGLEPPWMELQPGESADMVLQGFSRIVQEVQDYVICEAVIGTTSRMENIVETTITCKFTDPSIEISARQFSFRVEKKPSDVLALQYRPLAVKNTCSLPLDLMLDVERPFLVCDVDQQPLPDGQPLTLDVGQTCHLYVAFDPAYELDFNSWKEKKVLKINMVNGHPYVKYISLRGEVHFPNLQIQPSSLEFGCILAGTEEVRSLEMTNCSPLPVQYQWSFHSDSQVNRLRYKRYPLKFKPQPPEEKRTSLDGSAFQRRRFKIRSGEDPGTALRESWDPAQSLGAEVLPSTSEKYYIPLGLGGFRLSTDIPCTPLEVEKAFSILPQLGVLQPGERQRVSFTFSGHPDTLASATALCHVQGGPTYEVELTGEASCVSYSLSHWKISCGFQMFNEIHHSTVTLANTGKIKFDWVLNLSIAEQHLPGVFLVNPTAGSIAPGEKEVLKFSYMPGVPGAFSRTFQLKVGDLEPENICLKGEAFFPMITVNLPWNIEGNEKYEELIKPLQQDSQRRKPAVQKKTQGPKTGTLKTWNLKPRVPGSGIASNTQLQIETVMKLVKKPALELQEKLPSHPPDSRFPDKELCQTLVKVELPEYVLDMGPVRKGYPERRTLAITNPGQIPVSFQVDVSALQNTGFRVNLDQIQELPHRHTVMIEVCFESSHQPRGDVDVLLPIEVAKGPTYNIRLRATVLELSLDLSRNALQFSDILVGQCQIETVRLYNWFQVPCKWSIKAIEPVMKFLRMTVRSEYQKNFLMPPGAVGGTLPEVLENYEAQKRPKVQRAELKAMAEAMAEAEAEAMDKAAPAYDRAVTPSPEPMMEVTGNPVSWAVMRYLGIDPSSERREAQQDRRIVLIVHGPSQAGKTEVAAALCHYYDTAHLSIDTVVKEAIASDQSQAGHRAWELCTKAAMELKGEDEGKKPQLTAQTKNKQASGEENYEKNAKGKNPSAQKKEPVSKPNGEDTKFTDSTGPAPQQLSIIRSHGEELNCLSCVLPEDLLVDILCERLKREDCYKGVVFDGLESLFASSLESSLLCLLKAVKNCHHIYMVNLHQDCASWITKEENEREKEELQWKKPIQSSTECVLQMDEDEDEYDALPEKKALVDKTILERKHIQRERELKWLAQKLEEEAQALEEEERWKKEEKRKEEVKWKKEKKKKDVSLGKQPAKPEKKESKILGIKRTKILEKGKYKASKMWKIIISEKKGTKSPQKKETKILEREGPIIPEKWKCKAPKMWKIIIAEKGKPKAPGKGEPQAPEKEEPQAPEKEEPQAPEEGEPEAPEKEESQAPEKEESQAPEKEEPKAPEEGEPQAPEKEEPQAPEKEEPQAPEEGEPEAPEKEEPQAPEKEEPQAPEKEEPQAPEEGEPQAPEKEEPKAPEKEEPQAPEKEEPQAPEEGEPQAPEKEESQAPEKEEPKAPEEGETKIPEYSAEMEKMFQVYESSQQDVAQVFSYCDWVQGTVQLLMIQNRNTSQPSDENTGQKTNKPQEKVEKKPEQKSGGQRSLQSSQLETQNEVAEGAVRDVGMPCLDIQVTNPKAVIREILRDGRLPTKDEMLRCLGLHPEGPPLPPAAVLSVVDYPEERLGSAERVKPFTITALEGAAIEDNLAETPDVKGSSAEGQPKMGKVASRDNSPKDNQISTKRTESPQNSSATRSKSALKRASTPTELLRLKRYRWIVPDHGEVEVKVHFSTKKPGQFEQTLRFELVESKRQYELPCSGTGLYPSISQSPRLVFPQWRETMEADDVIFKEYVESTKQFHFGPLLCVKSREWYKAQNCPGNSESITILNNSPVDAEVQFSFENDGEAETFCLDPPNMTLKPEEKQELTIRAYPTSPGFLEDKLICCIEENPEPVVFSLCCHGVQVKLEVSSLELSFDKLLLHGTDSRTLVLKNNTLLPMAWQFSGLDDLVEAFSLSQDNGTIDPRSKFEVTLNFKAGQIGSIEKTLRLEVSDTENVLGIAQAENIKISAEVCDVSLSIDMPEGPDGSLEFGTINVLDCVKKVLTLKNKGIYNIEYRFILKGAGPRMRDLACHFTIEPQSGTLIASQPGTNVEMLFHPTREMLLKNKPILYCQVMDTSSGEGGQTVNTIPVRVSATAVYSKFSIEPASPIDFGAVVKGTKKTQTVMLENKGMLSFEFHIHQAPEDASALEIKSSEQEESSPSATKLKSSSSQDHLTVGMFTVSPCSGSVAPWDQQNITVDCLAGQEGTCEEQLYIDITGIDPKDNPLGVPFTLIAESCLPAIVEDVTLAFEEHLICSSTNLSCKLWSVKGVGLFVRDENKFIFTKVLVGQEAEAHVSIYNASGLPCDAFLSIKPRPGRVKSPINNIFKVFPAKMSIPSSSNGIAMVTFTPPDDQDYNCIFKAFLVMPKSSEKIKSQTLIFAISGKGYEPQLTVVCPSARSKRGNPVLRFKRLQVGDSEMLPLVMCNKGVIPVKFMLHLEDEQGAFFLKGRHCTLKKFYVEDVEEVCVGNESKPPKKPFLLLHHGQSTKFDVIFKPTLAQRLEGKIRVLVGDIYSNKTLIELVGEGHEDEFTLDGLEEDTEERNAKSSLKKDIIDAVRVNHIQFGDCPVGKPCHRTFTITNRTSMTIMRFEWEADATFQFSPKMGHLLPGCAKDITVTLKADVPAVFRRHLVKCKVTKVNVARPRRKVQDWNDQMSVVTWKDTTRRAPAESWPEKEKVVETAPEPAHTVEEESIQEAEVYLSAFVAYTESNLNTIVVQLKDTVPNQTRTATFRMHNRGNVALEYTWVEAADSEAVKRLHSITPMRQFLPSAPLRHQRKLLRPFWWQQEHSFETHPSGLQQLAEQQQDSEQQQQQQQQQQDSEQQKQQQDSEQQQQQDSEQQQQQDSEQQKQQQDSEQQQQDSEQQQQQQDSEQQQQQQDSEQQKQQQDSEQEPEQQQPEQQDHSKELHHSEQLHLSLQPVNSSLEIYPDVIQDLFFINPYHGIIAPGQKQILHVLFSPKYAGTFRTTMLFRTSDLKPPLKKAEVIVKGTALETQCLDKPKRSALRQTGKGQGPKKRVHWKPALLEHLS